MEAPGGRATIGRTVPPDEYREYHENVLQCTNSSTHSCKSILRCHAKCRRGNLVAQNARKTFSGRGSARTPLGELTALPRPLPGGEGDWLPLSNNRCSRSFGPLFSCSSTPKLCPSMLPHLIQAGDAPKSHIGYTTEICVFL